MLGAILLIIAAASAFWLLGFYLQTDWSAPTRDAANFNKVLAIFPHPDDEALSCGGFLTQQSAKGSQVTLHFLTLGERGTPNGEENPKLQEVRAKEAAAAARISHNFAVVYCHAAKGTKACQLVGAYGGK